MRAAGVVPCGDPIAYYEPRDDDTITVSAAVPVEADVGEQDGFAIAELAAGGAHGHAAAPRLHGRLRRFL